MRKLIIILFLLLFLPPISQSFAHGGVEDSVANVTVTFFNDPFAPIIGKNVLFTAIFTDKQNEKRLTNYSGVLTIKETVYGEEGKDITLLTKNVKSDENGTVTFNYTFPKDKIYDIEIAFPQIKEAENSVGYLLEPRYPQSSNSNSLYTVGLFTILGFALGIGFFFVFKNLQNIP